mgnify:CR=1 FL=1
MQPSDGSISPHSTLSFFSDSDDDETNSNQSSESAVYEARRILDSRTTDTGIEYSIKWKGYGRDDHSWELADNNLQASILLAEFEQEKVMAQMKRELVDEETREEGRHKKIRTLFEDLEIYKHPSSHRHPSHDMLHLSAEFNKEFIVESVLYLLHRATLRFFGNSGRHPKSPDAHHC